MVRVTVRVLVSANKPCKPMAWNWTGWLMFDYFQKVRFSTRYMWFKTTTYMKVWCWTNSINYHNGYDPYLFLPLVITSFTSNFKFKLVLTLRATLTRFSYFLISYNSLLQCYRCTLVLRCICDTLLTHLDSHVFESHLDQYCRHFRFYMHFVLNKMDRT